MNEAFDPNKQTPSRFLPHKLSLPKLTYSFTPQEFAMLARIVDEGMWELASQPHTPADEILWDRVCLILGVPGYNPKENA